MFTELFCFTFLDFPLVKLSDLLVSWSSLRYQTSFSSTSRRGQVSATPTMTPTCGRTRPAWAMTYTTSCRWVDSQLCCILWTHRILFRVGVAQLVNLISYSSCQAFFTEHPELVKNDFFITGESYAGHYIPALASRINAGNKAREGIHINLKVSTKISIRGGPY